MTREEFRAMFDHTLYDAARTKYNAVGAFPEVILKLDRNYFHMPSYSTGSITNCDCGSSGCDCGSNVRACPVTREASTNRVDPNQ